MQNRFLDLAKASYLNPHLSRPDWTQDLSRPEGPLWLNKNENVDPVLNNKIQSLIPKIKTYAINTYPETAKIYKKLSLLEGLDAKHFILTQGSDGAIRSVFDVFISPGDKVLHTSPTFAMYDVYSKMYGAKQIPLEYEYSPEGPVLNFSHFLELLKNEKPKLVCLPNPDSPTGTILEEDQLELLLKTATDCGALVLIDEAYFPFYPQTQIQKIKIYKNLLVCRSFSKAWGAAGFRVGFLAGDRELLQLFHKNRPMYEISTFSSELLYLLLDCKEDVAESVQRLLEGKKYFLNRMKESGYKTTLTFGNFVHVDFGRDTLQISEVLKNTVLYRTEFSNGSCLRGFSRFSLGTREQFESIIEKIASFKK
jgi:histidinol-phosphate aminotransferase